MTTNPLYKDLGDTYEITVDLPGIEQLEVTAEEGVATVRGQRRGLGVHRAVLLPKDIEVEQIQAEYLLGVLTLQVPKRVRRITVPVRV